MHPKLESIFKKILSFFPYIKEKIKEIYSSLVLWLNINWPPVYSKLHIYIKLTRFNQPAGSFLLLWPTLWALWIAASGAPDLKILIVFLVGVFLMHSVACVINDIIDRNFDAEILLNSDRPLASKQISVLEALGVGVFLILIAFLLVLMMNKLTIQLSVVAIFLICIQPVMKRYTYLTQFFLGLTFGLSIIMAFAAQTGTIPNIAWLLFIANILWSVTYNTMLSMVNREDDLKIGIKSTAILFDDADRIIIGIIQLILLLTFVIIGIKFEATYFYYISVLVSAIFFIYQQILIRNREASFCMKAFKNNNWVGLIIFIGIYTNYFLKVQ